MSKKQKLVGKKQLSSAIAKKSLLTIPEAHQVIEIIFDEISSQLEAGNSVNIKNFGKFVLHVQKPRPVIDFANPKDFLLLDSINIVKFKPSHFIKKLIKEASVDLSENNEELSSEKEENSEE
jgi:nucleoid DNA-binding protein